MMDALFYDKWVLALFCHYTVRSVSKDEFLVWCRDTLTRDMAGQPWDMGKALEIVGVNFDRWKDQDSIRSVPVQAKPVRSVAAIRERMEECLYLNDGSYGILQRELEDHPDWDGE
jgi:hypothetical protein